jgi:hypothetical protein
MAEQNIYRVCNNSNYPFSNNPFKDRTYYENIKGYRNILIANNSFYLKTTKIHEVWSF